MLSLAGPLVAALAGATAVAAQTKTPAPETAPTPTTGTPVFSVLTITLQALTTKFTPPPKCMESHLSMMSPPKYEIWLNEPQPVPGETHGECYPSEFMQGYKSMANSSSSIAPFFKPLVCPEGWHTASEWPNGYIACCNSGYNLVLPTTTADPERPAYGGTCYSNFLVGQTVNVTKYGPSSMSGTGLFPATSVADQAYAHLMDGYKMDANSPSSVRYPHSGLNGGAIAGIVIGVVAALIAIALAVFLLFRRRRQLQPQAGHDHGAPAVAQSGYAPSDQTNVQKDVISPTTTAYSHDPSAGGNAQWQQPPSHELDPRARAAELESAHLQGELESNWHGHELESNYQRNH
ncbi:hypothetical protein PG999_000474 [Apiospora kogelbergensis]|uniref:Uncharacterized protein n=1 Tax=Apiospora kogelbergensis TaxID=1337665 RepID=A0AAW0RBZ5_9PEZI